MERVPLLRSGHLSVRGEENSEVTQGGFVTVDLTKVKSTQGQNTGAESAERVEVQKEMSASAAILGAIVGNEEARTYIEQKVARVNLAVESIFFFGAVIVVIVEGTTGSLDLSAMGWVADVVVIYTSGAGAYYARQTDRLVGFSYQVDRLRGQVTRLGEEVDRLSPQIDRLTGENDRYTGLLAQHAAMQTEMESLVGGMTAKYAEFAETEGALQENVVEIEAAVEGLAALKKSMDALFPKLDAMVEGLTGQVQELTGQVGELTGQVDKLQGEVDRLGGQIGELTVQVDELEAARRGLQKSVTMLAGLGAEADKQGAFDEKVNVEARRLQAEETALLVKQTKLQEQREVLQTQQAALLDRESKLVAQLEGQTARLEKFRDMEGAIMESKFKDFRLEKKVAALEKERDVAKEAAKAQTVLLLAEREQAAERLRTAEVYVMTSKEEERVTTVAEAVLRRKSSAGTKTVTAHVASVV